ncbi:MAG: 50S ribosomal protein L19 [Terriglobia bacterium]
MSAIDKVVAAQLRRDLPPFKPGDSVRIHVKIREGDKERIQPFEGIVIGRRGRSVTQTFTVRKVSFGIGVERICPFHSPVIARIEILRSGKVRRAKLYYLRGATGKRAHRITEAQALTTPPATPSEPPTS